MVSKLTRLPHEILLKCIEWGFALHEWYKEDEARRIYTANEIWKYPMRLAASKTAEPLFCLEYGLDPMSPHVLNWTPRDGPDAGYDVGIFRYDIRVDVKQCQANADKLFWSANKRNIFHRRNFNTLVMVCVSIDGKVAELAHRETLDAVWGYSEGWISKSEFFRLHKVGAPFTPGTMWVHANELMPMAELPGWTTFPVHMGQTVDNLP